MMNRSMERNRMGPENPSCQNPVRIAVGISSFSFGAGESIRCSRVSERAVPQM